MYNSFHVKNFRCFKDLQINDLGRVNLIAGRNNTGKTALMEAMYLHTRPLSPKALLDLQDVRGIQRPAGHLSVYWRQLFYDMDPALKIDIAGNEDVDSESHTLEITEYPNNRDTYGYVYGWYDSWLADRMIRDLNPSNVAESVDVFLRFSLGQSDHLSYSNDTLVASDQKVPIFPNDEHNRKSRIVPTQGRPDEESVRRQFSQIDSTGNLNYVIEFLQAFEPRLEDLRLTEPYGITMLSGRVNNRLIPLRLMGDGINSVCHFVLTMMADELDYLFIDEIENGIHHSVQCNVWKAIGQLARDLDIQVFATTHSLEMIRAAYEAYSEDKKLDEFRFHRLDRDRETGDIEAVTYNKRGLEAVAAFDFDFEVRG